MPNGSSSSASPCAQIPPALAAIGLDPAALAQQRLGAGVPGELQMLAGGSGHERRHDRAGRELSRLRRGLEIAQKRRRDRGQRAIADVGARIAIHRRPGDVANRAREQIGEHALGLDDAAVSEAGLARRVGQAVDQRDGSAARLEERAQPRRRQFPRQAQWRQRSPTSGGRSPHLKAMDKAGPPRISASVPIEP